MSMYAEQNGRAKSWDRDHVCLEMAKWVYHHPDFAYSLYDQLQDDGEILPPETEDQEPDTWTEELPRNYKTITFMVRRVDVGD